MLHQLTVQPQNFQSQGVGAMQRGDARILTSQSNVFDIKYAMGPANKYDGCEKRWPEPESAHEEVHDAGSTMHVATPDMG